MVLQRRLLYAELQDEPPGRLLGGIAIFSMVIVALLALVLLALGDISDPSQWRRWSPALAGLLFGGGLVYAGRRSGLLRQTGLTRGNLSSHVSKLEEAGLVEVEKSFVDKIPRTLYRITKAGRAALKTYRRQMQLVLEDLPE